MTEGKGCFIAAAERKAKLGEERGNVYWRRPPMCASSMNNADFGAAGQPTDRLVDEGRRGARCSYSIVEGEAFSVELAAASLGSCKMMGSVGFRCLVAVEFTSTANQRHEVRRRDATKAQHHPRAATTGIRSMWRCFTADASERLALSPAR